MLVRDETYNLMAWPVWETGEIADSILGRLRVASTRAAEGAIFEASDDGKIFVWKVIRYRLGSSIAMCARMKWSE